MGSIKQAYLMPHPPVIIPQVGKGKETDSFLTVLACKKVSQQISEIKPSVVIIATPHGHSFLDYIYMNTKQELKGSLSEFGAKDIHFSYRNNFEKTAKKHLEHVYIGNI